MVAMVLTSEEARKLGCLQKKKTNELKKKQEINVMSVIDCRRI